LTTEGLWVTGTFINGEAEGVGKVEFPGGSIYQGDLVAGQAHGEGDFTGSTALCLKGLIPCRWNLESKYKGDWERNRPNGYGIYVRDTVGNPRNRIIYEGHWKEGALHGPGFIIIE
jgi:hypothetical protein